MNGRGSAATARQRPREDENESHVILKQYVDVHRVQKARRALDENPGKNEPREDEQVLVVHVFENLQGWPPECKALLKEVMVSSQTPFINAKFNVSMIQFLFGNTFLGQIIRRNARLHSSRASGGKAASSSDRISVQ